MDLERDINRFLLLNYEITELFILFVRLSSEVLELGQL